MALTLRICGSAIYQIGSRFLLFVGANLAAALLSLPLIVLVLLLATLLRSFDVVPLGLAVLVGALPNPGAMGLHTLAREAANQSDPGPRDQWSGLGRQWRFALKVWIVSAAVLTVCCLNVIFYVAQASSPSSTLNGIAVPLAIIWMLPLVFWLGMHLYVSPLLLARERDDLLLVYRNAAVLAVTRPITTWTTVPLWAGILLLSSATGLAAIIGLALGASIQQNALRVLLPTFILAAE